MARLPTKNDDTCQHPVVLAINDKLERDQERDGRRHLGGSMIGRKCLRELWYGFRWALAPDHSARMLRLFNRGHREEDRFVEWLRAVGVEHYPFQPHDYVLAYHDGSGAYLKMSLEEWRMRDIPSEPLDDVTGILMHEYAARLQGIDIPEPKQIRVLDVDGHFGGSLDGIGRYFPGVAQILNLPHDEWGLTEFKTHGRKSFEKLLEERVEKAKPEHFNQMQVYMYKKGLRFALYMAICKDTDRLYSEFILADPQIAVKLIAKATEVVYSRTPPRKIGSTPAWFECKFCDFVDVCHRGAPMQKNCRTCVSSSPAPDGRWVCARYGMIPKDAEAKGCDNWEQIKA